MVLKDATAEPRARSSPEAEVTWADRLSAYRTHILIGVVVVALAILAVYVITGLGREKEQNAWYETRDLRNQAYMALSFGDPTQAERVLRELTARVDEYAGTSVHPVLVFLKALLEEAADKPEDALATLQALRSQYPEHPLVNPAHYAPGDTPPAVVEEETIRANLQFYREVGKPFAKQPEPAPNLRAVVHVKDYGAITLGFFPEYAPKHVANFLRLAREGFYNGTTFHRITDFCIQGGDPNSKDDDPANDGQGGPGYSVPKEIYLNPVLHKRGILAAAAQDPAGPDNGSQFFICTKDSPHLDGSYTPFGKVLEGMDVVERIATEPTQGPNEQGIPPDRPVKAILIEKVTVQGDFRLPPEQMPGPPPKATKKPEGAEASGKAAGKQEKPDPGKSPKKPPK